MDITETYTEEAIELLFELETSLLELENKPNEKGLISSVFRAMHTIKGSGAMAGFTNIAEFTHDIETVFDLVRNNIIPVTKELIDLTLSSCDIIKKMVYNEPLDEYSTEEIVRRYKAMIPETENTSQGMENECSESSTEDENIDAELTYRIRFRPSADIFANGTNPFSLLNEIRMLGKCRVIAQTTAIPDLNEINPEQCYFFWDLILTTEKNENAIRDIFIFVEDGSDIDIQIIADSKTLIDDEKHKKIGEILLEKEDISVEELTRALKTQKRIGEVLIGSGKLDKDRLRSALEEQEHIRLLKNDHKKKTTNLSIRVPSEKLDTLVDLVGELVTVQARLTQYSLTQDSSELISIAEEVERFTAELRDNTMSIRMLPIGTTFSKFKRMVRDLSSELGKEVILTTEGGETELDKTVIESLNDPMVHIIRNSIDHGIEPPGVREAIEKTRQGTIHLSATHSGGYVLIKISDDGAGLDAQTIHNKAKEKGFLPPDSELNDRELYSLIFEPGFSTAGEVTNVSGRGVGMDVVKKSIENLRGTIEIDSQKGEGTTITLKLPLTLAIIDGLLVQMGETRFVIPLSSVEECVELTCEDNVNSNGRHIMRVRDEILPYVPLRKLFEINGGRPPIEQIVIADLDGHRLGFVVDQIIGEHQTVIKNLGKIYKDTKGFSGATILADGTVALILDAHGLSDIAKMEEGNC